MNHCRDCKFFGKNEEQWEPAAKGWGFCAVVRSYGEAPCANILAIAVDAESYHAELSVSPDFGCVHFEAKEELT